MLHRSPTQAFPFPATLHPLALLRASELGFATTGLVVGDAFPIPTEAIGESNMQRSFGGRETRATLQLLYMDGVKGEGGQVEDVRACGVGRRTDGLTGRRVTPGPELSSRDESEGQV